MIAGIVRENKTNEIYEMTVTVDNDFLLARFFKPNSDLLHKSISGDKEKCAFYIQSKYSPIDVDIH